MRRINHSSRFIEMFGTIERPKTKQVLLGDICDVKRGGSPRPIADYITDMPDGLNWIKIGDADDSMYITHTSEKIKPSGLSKTRQVYVGDLLLSNSMSFGRPYILKIDGCIHDGWLVLHFDHTIIDSIFLCFYLSQDSTYAEMSKMAAGGVVNNLNADIVRTLKINLPNIDEQMLFVSMANRADKSKFSDFKSRFIEQFAKYGSSRKLGDVVELMDDKRRPINDAERQSMKTGKLYPYYGATGQVDMINSYLTDDTLLCIAEDCGNYKEGEE